MLDNALYTYVFAKKPYTGLSRHLPFAGFVLSASQNTSCALCEKDGRALLVAGFCVDAHGEIDRKDIASYLLDKAPNLQALLTLQLNLDKAQAVERDLVGHHIVDDHGNNSPCPRMSAGV
ncbi:MAG: hypothetical protein RR739_10945, partial [Clostridia bacterium]